MLINILLINDYKAAIKAPSPHPSPPWGRGNPRGTARVYLSQGAATPPPKPELDPAAVAAALS